MAYSRVLYSGNAVQTNFAIPFPYLSVDTVQVYVNSVIQIAYTFPDATHILFDAAPAAGTNNVEFRRHSGQNALVDFADGGPVVESDLDTAFLQSLYIAQEAYDAVTATNTVLISVADLTDMTALGESLATAATAAAARTILGVPAISHTHAAADVISGTLGSARLGSSTANNTTYLRGDQAWSPLSDIPKPAFMLTPTGAFFPSTNFPQLLKNAGTNRVDYTLDFDTTTGESAEWEVLIPTGAVFTGASIELASRQAANTTGTVGWIVGIVSSADNEAWDTAVSNTTVTAATVKAIAGKILKQTATPSVSGWAAGELLTIRITRDVANDNANEDSKLMSAVLRLT